MSNRRTTPNASGIENPRPNIEHYGGANCDTGVGIPPDKIDAVFEPFVQLATNFSSRQGGIGLGLTISRQFARGMRGELAVASGIAEGASFRLTLPLAQPQD